MNAVPDPIIPDTFLGYSRESNSGPLGWQSDVRTNHYTKQEVEQANWTIYIN